MNAKNETPGIEKIIELMDTTRSLILKALDGSKMNYEEKAKKIDELNKVMSRWNGGMQRYLIDEKAALERLKLTFVDFELSIVKLLENNKMVESLSKLALYMQGLLDRID